MDCEMRFSDVLLISLLKGKPFVRLVNGGAHGTGRTFCSSSSIGKISSRSDSSTTVLKFHLVKPMDQDHTRAALTSLSLIPSHVEKPFYTDGRPVPPNKPQKNLTSASRIEGIRNACRLARSVLNYVGSQVQPGVTTEALDRTAFDYIISHGAYPSPLNYNGYPKSICTSVNNVACHGIPDSRQLMNGDIANVDVTVYIGGYHGDCSMTFPVGRIDDDAKRLLEVTEAALYEGISVCRNGQDMSQIGETIEIFAAEHGYSVIPLFTGHGIGEYFHMHPQVVHRANEDTTVMETGMVFTVEPILSEGSDEVTILKDGWTAISKDDSRNAQFEETILILEEGAEILTR